MVLRYVYDAVLLCQIFLANTDVNRLKILILLTDIW